MGASLRVPDALIRGLQGRYVIKRRLGEGGMATVYLAGDLKHDRNVALKVLRPELGAVLGKERFLAEIRVTASLQHPHLLPLFDSGEAGGFLYYVMPYVEGESLRARMEREKQLPVEEAVRIAVAVANALDYAHQHGVVHRDLKPENILLQAGQPLVADFGIALAVSLAGGQRVTQTGLSLGTPQYTSPEQATGDLPVDARSDLYSLAAVAYEMLAGDPPHVASTTHALLARVLTEQPRRLRSLRSTVPEHVESAVQRGLEKLPADRFSSARELAAALTDPGFRHGQPRPDGDADPAARRSSPGALALTGWAAAAVLSLLWVFSVVQSNPAPTIARFVLDLPSDHRPTALAATPDGKEVIYAAGELYRRPLRDLDPVPIPSGHSASDFAVSPDGQWLAFVARPASVSILKKVRLSGGPAVDVAEHPYIRGITWESSDHIILGSHEGGLWRVPAAGGAMEPLTQPTGAPHRYPRALPNGRGVVFHIGGSVVGDQVAVLPGGATEWRILAAGTDPQYVPTGHLVFYRDGSAWAAKFDLRRLEISGEPVPVLASVGRVGEKMVLEWSPEGSLFYVEPSAPPELTLAWASRDGTEEPVSVPSDSLRAGIALSPSGSALIVNRGERLWLHDLERQVSEPLTGEAASEWDAIWSPDGAEVFFMSRRDGPFDLYRIPVGAGERTVTAVGTGGGTPLDWTPDGRGLLYQRDGVRIWWLAEGRGELLLESGTGARISPDGRFIAYQSHDALGVSYVEARPFPDVASNRWRMPGSDAGSPRWSADASLLYYRVDGAIMAAAVDPSADVPFGMPARILDGPFAQYAPGPDGRFLVLKALGAGVGPERGRVMVVQHWFEELTRLVPD